LFDKSNILSETSSKSSKLLHGGIRYLEQGHIPFVYKALIDRYWWKLNAPDLCKTIEIVCPVYRNSPRGKFKMFFGAKMYEYLSLNYSLGKSKLDEKSQLRKLQNDLTTDNYIGSVSYFDLQMNEEALGQWVLKSIRERGVNIYENSEVESINQSGSLVINGHKAYYDFLINAAGPWASKLLEKSNLKTNHSLKYIKGSHLVFDHEIHNSYLLQVPNEKRIIFFFPYNGKTILGTTEIEVSKLENPNISDIEIDYLLNNINKFTKRKYSQNDISDTFSGIRPIFFTKNRQGKISELSRDTKIEINQRLINIFGGKWTSSVSLGRKCEKIIQKFL